MGEGIFVSPVEIAGGRERQPLGRALFLCAVGRTIFWAFARMAIYFLQAGMQDKGRKLPCDRPPHP
jgi:hypothetical protein